MIVAGAMICAIHPCRLIDTFLLVKNRGSTSNSNGPGVTGREIDREITIGSTIKGRAVTAGNKDRHMLSSGQDLQTLINCGNIPRGDSAFSRSQTDTDNTTTVGILHIIINNCL